MTSLYAERGRWSQVGTLVSHLAAVGLIVAVACRPALGWQESDLVLLPGEIYHVGHGYDLEVRAGEPVAGPRPGVPLVLVTGGTAVTETVGLNRPLTFRGLTFHLQGCGPAVRVAAPDGTLGVALSGSQAQEIPLPEAGFSLRISPRLEEGTLFVEVLAAGGAFLGSGQVTPGQEIEVGGLPITFSLTEYTRWQVGRDPTFGLAVASAILLLVAAVLSLWVPYRRLWVRVDGEGRALMAGAGDWGPEFDIIAEEIARAGRPGGEGDG